MNSATLRAISAILINSKSVVKQSMKTSPRLDGSLESIIHVMKHWYRELTSFPVALKSTILEN